MMAGFRTLVGGEVTDYADMLTEARQIATGRMVKDAESPWRGCCCGNAVRLRQRHAGRGRGHCLRNGGEVRMTSKRKTGLRPILPVRLWSWHGCVRSAAAWRFCSRITPCCISWRSLSPCSARCWLCCWCKRSFLRQPTGIGWKVQGKRRFWLAAWFGPAVLTLLGAVLYFAVFPLPAGLFRQLAGSRLRRRDGRPDPAQASWASPPSATCCKTGLFAVHAGSGSSICSPLWARRSAGAAT